MSSRNSKTSHPGTGWPVPLSAVVTAALVACTLPLLTGAADEETKQNTSNRARIEEMTELERRQLEQRFARYKQLSIEERDRLRSMHAEIERNSELAETVAAYRQWLGTLSPIEREQLRNEQDPRRKLAIVERIRARQREEERTIRPFESFAARFGESRRPMQLDPDELEALYGVLEKHLPPDDRARVQAIESPSVRRIETLRSSMGHAFRPPRPGERFRPPRFPSDAMLTEIRTAVGEEGPLGTSLDAAKSDESRRARVVMYLAGSVWREIGREWERRKPSDEDLQRHFATLPPAERDRLSSLLSKEEFERELRKSYISDKGTELGDVRPLLQRLSFLARSGRPQFGGGRGRPDDDRPGERQGPFGRPGGGRRPGSGRPGGEGRGDGPPGEGRSFRDRGRDRSGD